MCVRACVCGLLNEVVFGRKDDDDDDDDDYEERMEWIVVDVMCLFNLFI